MDRERKVTAALEAMGIRSESDLRAEIKRTAVNIRAMAGTSKTELERLVGK